MKNNILPYIFTLIVGGIGSFATFIIWNSHPKTEMVQVILITSGMFFFLGLVTGMLKVHKVWLGWLALHAAAVLSLGPGIVQFLFSASNHGDLASNPEVRQLTNFVAALIFVPMVFSLPGVYLGKRYLTKEQSSGEALDWQVKVRKGLIGLAGLALPVLVGVMGMFGVMIVGFMAFTLKIEHPAFQVIAFPLIFSVLTALLTYFRGKWFVNGLLIGIVPLVLWLLPQLGKHPGEITWWDFSNESFKAMVINVAILAAGLLSAYLVSRWKAKRARVVAGTQQNLLA
jgi:hypothetical protein